MLSELLVNGFRMSETELTNALKFCLLESEATRIQSEAINLINKN